MTDFRSQVKQRIAEIHQYLTSLKDGKRIWDGQSLKEPTLKKSTLGLDDPDTLKSYVQKYASEKRTLLRLAEYAKIRGLLNKVEKDRDGDQIEVTYKNMYTLEPIIIFGWTVREYRTVYYYEKDHEPLKDYLKKHLAACDEFKQNTDSLIESKLYGYSADRMSSIVYFYDKTKKISELNVKTNLIKPKLDLLLNDILDKNQFTYHCYTGF